MTSPKRPTRAFLLAAGKGERMRPLTDTLPKPLVRLAGKPLIDHVLDRLAEAKIEHAVVNVHYLADQIERHLADRAAPTIQISDERDALLDTGGGVVRALPLLGADPFLIHNSDSVWIEGFGSNLDRLIDAWDETKMDSLLLMAPMATSIGYSGRGDFAMDAEGRLTRQGGGARLAPFVFAGVSIAHPRLFDGAPAGPFSLNHVWDRARAAGRLFGLRLDGLWMHVGTPEAVIEAEKAIADSAKPGSVSRGAG
ncbi:mannose-1-phosphate guanylyltransferase [Hyphomicrobium methylovorum]|uniref:nucleotidyltransferase family protein n=1 Tax=Hyphomicrobium methylovorum TaxID=84 RepID=UPI0015E739CA|nr:nucleotidyltransferase family protein [Hyphomicrobium methylovorum]MBA2125554.1 mannose-1-phosphate guanylyltransferase [Hyphomicrobium methylovorum]